MADEQTPTTPRSKDEIALELMKFIVASTGYGKAGTQPGFSTKPARSPEEQIDALLELYGRCRQAIGD